MLPSPQSMIVEALLFVLEFTAFGSLLASLVTMVADTSISFLFDFALHLRCDDLRVFRAVMVSLLLSLLFCTAVGGPDGDDADADAVGKEPRRSEV
jgi:hypothetical protein